MEKTEYIPDEPEKPKHVTLTEAVELYRKRVQKDADGNDKALSGLQDG